MFSSNPTPQEFFALRIFTDPLVPLGASPTLLENKELAAAISDYRQRTSPRDVSSITRFLDTHPQSPWAASLLTNLALEYYNTGHYSGALAALVRAWDLAKEAREPNEKAVADRAVGELAYLYARLGRMVELDALLESVKTRPLSGPATERIGGAQEGLSNMRHRPELSFHCGPLALQRIQSATAMPVSMDLIRDAASGGQGFSLPQVAQLSKQLGMNYQMAFRASGSVFVIPSVVHLKLDHYAALVKREGDWYLLQDSTFRNDTWVAVETLEAEASGFFLIPEGELPRGWRAVGEREGQSIRGKGDVGGRDPDGSGCKDQTNKDDQCCKGLASARIHLFLVSLNINDEPVGYVPPLGPDIRLTVRYNQREFRQPANFNYSNLGPKWTFDWLSYITDNPMVPPADVRCYRMGGGSRTYTGFRPADGSYAVQQHDRTRLIRTSATSYEMVNPDGSRNVFDLSDGRAGSERTVFLTKMFDAFGNLVSLEYDSQFRIVRIRDAIGQVTTLAYELTTDPYKLTRVIDPFGRFATFAYDSAGRLRKITDVIGLVSEFTYAGDSDFIETLTTPYGATTFSKETTSDHEFRFLEIKYPDGNRERVEFNQFAPRISNSDSPDTIPIGMATTNDFLQRRNTYYWDKKACAEAYGDFTKARIYHWLHANETTPTGALTAANILESIKAPLEGRIWYDYAGQRSSIYVGTLGVPNHVGRVLDDGFTQLYSYEYDTYGNLTKATDPLGRVTVYLWAENGIDLLEERQAVGGQFEMQRRFTYISACPHLPITRTDAAGQTTVYGYNARGQVLSETNPKGDTTTYTYDDNHYLKAVDRPLAGDRTTYTYDSHGRIHTETDCDGYLRTTEYDDLDRVTKITYPDGTFDEYTYENLERKTSTDRAGRRTVYEYDHVGQMMSKTDALGRVLRYQWCKCGDLKSITDPLGRTTRWRHDIQGRVTEKEFVDGSTISYRYEQNTSRLKQTIDAKLQVKEYSYYRDNSVNAWNYSNAKVYTPSVRFRYDADYDRLTHIMDGGGTTQVRYHPSGQFGAGKTASIDGPLDNDTIELTCDAFGRVVTRSIGGVTDTVTLDAAGRIQTKVDALGVQLFSYDGASQRLKSVSYPNGQLAEFDYEGILKDLVLKRILNTVPAGTLSEFVYDWDVPKRRIRGWSQRIGASPVEDYAFDYDDMNQLTEARISQGGALLHRYAYTYDTSGNRLSETLDGVTALAYFNTLNQITSGESPAIVDTTYAWDGERRLSAVVRGNDRTECSYDWQGRRVRIHVVSDGVEAYDRRYVWSDFEICEERDSNGLVLKQFFSGGLKAGTNILFCARDHLRSIREIVDVAGSLRAQYVYDPFGRSTKVGGDIESDFGFAGMLFEPFAGINLAIFRGFDPAVGRWLSRDPLTLAERIEGPNLYSYVKNNPVALVDPYGLCCEIESLALALALAQYFATCAAVTVATGGAGLALCYIAGGFVTLASAALTRCLLSPCPPPQPPSSPSPSCVPPPRCVTVTVCPP